MLIFFHISQYLLLFRDALDFLRGTQGDLLGLLLDRLGGGGLLDLLRFRGLDPSL